MEFMFKSVDSQTKTGKATAVEPTWIVLPPVVTLCVVAIYARWENGLTYEFLRWGPDLSLILAGSVMAWRGRDRMLGSLIASTLTLAAAGIGVSDILSKHDALPSGLRFSAQYFGYGMLAASLSWVGFHFLYLILGKLWDIRCSSRRGYWRRRFSR